VEGYGFSCFAKDVFFFLPLGSLLVGGLFHDKHAPDSPFFAAQRWRYTDVVLVFILVTTVGLFKLIPSLARLPELTFHVLTTSSRALCIIIGVYTLLRSKYGLPLSSIGLRKEHSMYYVAWSLAVVVALVLIGSVILSYFVLGYRSVDELIIMPGTPKPDTALDNFRRQSVDIQLLAVILYLNAAALMPFAEEILIRGFLLTPLSRKFGSRAATIFSAALFSVVHGPTVKAIAAFGIGIIYVYLYRRTESLIPSLTLHVTGNTFVVLMMFATDLQHPERLLIPLIALSSLLFIILWSLALKLGPSDPDQRLAWS